MITKLFRNYSQKKIIPKIYNNILCLLITYFAVDYDSDCLMKSQKIVKNNKTYVNFEKMKIKIKINKAVLNFNNLFGGDSVLGMLLFHTIYLYILRNLLKV